MNIRQYISWLVIALIFFVSCSFEKSVQSDELFLEKSKTTKNLKLRAAINEFEGQNVLPYQILHQMRKSYRNDCLELFLLSSESKNVFRIIDSLKSKTNNDLVNTQSEDKKIFVDQHIEWFQSLSRKLKDGECHLQLVPF